jgi:hypothetical protein
MLKGKKKHAQFQLQFKIFASLFITSSRLNNSKILTKRFRKNYLSQTDHLLPQGKRKTKRAVKNHSPQYLRKRSHFGIRYHKTLPLKEEEQWGSGGLQA